MERISCFIYIPKAYRTCSALHIKSRSALQHFEWSVCSDRTRSLLSRSPSESTPAFAAFVLRAFYAGHLTDSTCQGPVMSDIAEVSEWQVVHANRYNKLLKCSWPRYPSKEVAVGLYCTSKSLLKLLQNLVIALGASDQSPGFNMQVKNKAWSWRLNSAFMRLCWHDHDDPMELVSLGKRLSYIKAVYIIRKGQINSK